MQQDINIKQVNDEQVIAHLQERFGHLDDVDEIIEAFRNRHDPDSYFYRAISAEEEGEIEIYSYDDDGDRWSWVMLSNVIELEDGVLRLGIKQRWESDDEDDSDNDEYWIDLGAPNAQELEAQRDSRISKEVQEMHRKYIVWVEETGKHPLPCAFNLPDHLNWKDHSQREAVKEWVREKFSVLFMRISRLPDIQEIKDEYKTVDAWIDSIFPISPIGLPDYVADIAKVAGIEPEGWYWWRSLGKHVYEVHYRYWLNLNGDQLSYCTALGHRFVELNGRKVAWFNALNNTIGRFDEDMKKFTFEHNGETIEANFQPLSYYIWVSFAPNENIEAFNAELIKAAQLNGIESQNVTVSWKAELDGFRSYLSI